jgi:hypothetical protein
MEEKVWSKGRSDPLYKREKEGEREGKKKE